MLRGTGRGLTKQRSKMGVLPAPGYTRTYTGRKAILRMPRIGTSVRASLRAAVRFKRNGLRLQKLSSANVTAGGNLAKSVPSCHWVIGVLPVTQRNPVPGREATDDP